MAAKKKATGRKTKKSPAPPRRSSEKPPAGARSKTSGGDAKRPSTAVKRKAAGKKPLPTAVPATAAASPVAPFPIVGIGASAGGLEALEEFFRHMSVDSGMAFVVVMHQAAKHVSLLPDLLDKRTKMKVTAIHNRMQVLKNCVYVVPPGKNVDLLQGTLHLSDLPAKHAAPLPIDHFFRSLAAERRERAVAIVLSGTGSDGTVGLSAIKGESGMVMVQSLESARFSGMPQSAIDAGLADYVLTPAEMPARLIAYALGPFLKAPPTNQLPAPAIRQALPDILLKLRRSCGHDFSGYKPSTICRRIERRMNVHQIDQPAQYLRYLDEHKPEAETLFRELLIGVTSFFRDPWAFENLRQHALIPLLKGKTNDSQFRAWVPACATGEEAYSIAILLRECMEELKIHLHVQIFATDLDAAAIEAARRGTFPSGIGTDVSSPRLERYFRKDEGRYRICQELRDWLVFAPQNVIHDPPFTNLDLISCRNLLIYMQPQLQKKLLTLFHYSLQADGCMFLGTSETISEFGDLFETLSSKAKIFRRKEPSPAAVRIVQFPVVGSAKEKDNESPAAVLKRSGAGVSDSISQMLAYDFAPPTVIVSESGEIVHVHGRTGEFLELAPGGLSRNVVAMAREGLELELASALRSAARQDQPVVRRNVMVKTNGQTTLINLLVQKIAEPASLRGLLRISFLTVSDVAAPAPDREPRTSDRNRAVTEPREIELERELQASRESLQRIIEELDASNEEMKSTNEELQSTNEELQSTNEELETSKEELQSLNEELLTVNAELQEKNRELLMANDDMNNLLNSTNIATLFLDNRLCIKRFTEQAKRIVRLIVSDVGRSLRDLTSRLSYEDLLTDGEKVLRTLIPKEQEVQTEDGRWLLMRILPYRTSDDKIDGLVMTFVDIDESKRARDAAATFMENIIATVREPLLVLDGSVRVRFANRAFYEVFQVKPHDTVGQAVYNLGGGQWDIPALRQLLDDIVQRGSSFDGFEVIHDFASIGRKRMLLNARRITASEGEPDSILLALELKD